MNNIVALILATSVLVIIPGPNVALIVANSIRLGLRFGMITTMGTTAGLAVQLFFVVAGLAATISIAASALGWIRWLGVAYLLYLGIRTWREPVDGVDSVHGRSDKATFWRGFGLALINPKTLMFNAAFLPQFVGINASPGTELFLLAAVYLGVVLLGDVLWAVFAALVRRGTVRFGRLRNRVTGALLFGGGLALAMSRRSV